MIPKDELADRVHAVTMGLLREVRDADGAAGLDTGQISALSTLVYDGPLSVGELAAAEHVGAPVMSRRVTALERAGYVQRESGPSEGVRAEVAPTQAGVEALAAARQRRVARLSGLLSELEESSQEAVLEATMALQDVLDGSGG